ncbi:MAG: hypothetical protein AVDCRST_MAG19-265 [uncultured Thermomicrobiales bacterium]|uniref:Uncharacterized protein n=1 Tax=uncultured Thermomicrobiales bacterium TaxID=1645740 RepID=A0A6J4UBU0_9BACT|nr:MAG: hypothetical protein AVDCRST_MAG19-265 [uncultured Thermomicrobiales bacterium]
MGPRATFRPPGLRGDGLTSAAPFALGVGRQVVDRHGS